MTANLDDRNRKWEVDRTGPNWRSLYEEAATILRNLQPNWDQVPQWVWRIMPILTIKGKPHPFLYSDLWPINETLERYLEAQLEATQSELENRKDEDKDQNTININAKLSAYQALSLLLVYKNQSGPESHEYNIVQRILAELGEPEYEDSIKLLVYEFFKQLQKLSNILPALKGIHEAELPDGWDDIQDEMLKFDVIFANFLESFGLNGRKKSAEIKNKSKIRLSEYNEGKKSDGFLWKIWQLDPAGNCRHARYALLLCEVLWLDVVKPQLERKRRKAGPALPHPVAEKSADMTQRGNSIGPEPQGNGHILYNAHKQPVLRLYRSDGPVLPAHQAENLVSVLTNGAQLLGSVYTLKLLWWLCGRVWEQWINGENSTINIVKIEGGWGGLCEQLKIPNQARMRKELRAIVQFLAHGYFSFPDGTSGNLLTYNEDSNPLDKRSKKIIITAGIPLLPDTVDSLQGNADPARKARRLVPLAPIPSEPEEMSRDKYGAVANLYLRTLTLMRERCSQIEHHLGVNISEEDWQTMGTNAGLSLDDIQRILTHWTTKGGWLEKLPTNRYHIADIEPYKFARQMLAEAGRAEVQGSIAGKNRVANKARKLKQ